MSTETTNLYRAITAIFTSLLLSLTFILNIIETKKPDTKIKIN